ncbi:MAG: hypothetical protein LWW86_16495 [Micrococcales bacterium]|nr:hypothetical protein [Micrococcales bacterium]
MPKVETAAIRRHANIVKAQADEVDAMSRAASVDGQAFGMILSWLPGLFNSAFGDIDAAFDAAATTARQTENGLRYMADRYDADDEQAAFELRSTYP